MFYRISQKSNFTRFVNLNVAYESGYLGTTGLVCPVCEKPISKDEGFLHVFNCQGEKLGIDDILGKLNSFGFKVENLKAKIEFSQTDEKKLGLDEINGFNDSLSSNKEYYFLEFDIYLVFI